MTLQYSTTKLTIKNTNYIYTKCNAIFTNHNALRIYTLLNYFDKSYVLLILVGKTVDNTSTFETILDNAGVGLEVVIDLKSSNVLPRVS